MSPLHPLLGHREAQRALARAHASGILPSGLLLHGPEGVGKQRLGLWIAQLLLCESPHAEEGPCGVCRTCRQVLRLEHPDLHWYFPLPRPKGASTPEKLEEKLEEARHEALAERRESPLHRSHQEELVGLYVATSRSIRRRASKRPSAGTRQVFLIGAAEALVPQESSPEAANALLKLLEEPPASTTFILTSAEPHALLPTIRSRLLHLHLSPLPLAEVEHALVEWAGATPQAAGLAARLSRGSLGRALAFLSDGDGPGPLDRTRLDALAFLRSALGPAPDPAYAYALSASAAGGRGWAPLLDEVAEWLRDLAAAAAGLDEPIVNVDQRELLTRMVRAIAADPHCYAPAVDAVFEARALALGNANPQLLLFQLAQRLREVLLPAR
ncbi:MAG: hypothetical protein R3E10_19010 [Gemmatimonadota bacterium]